MISAQEVQTLRKKTGAGMMDCKRALVDAGGDFAKAEKLLKELGLAAADKRSGRITKEGKIFSLIKNNKAVILELSCETDFVARNKDFNELGRKLLETIHSDNISEINEKLQTMVKEVIGIIKENMALRRFHMLDIADDELALSYIHVEGKIGVIVKVKMEKASLKDNETLKKTTYDLALHITSSAPLYLSRDKVDPAYLKEQEEIFKKQAASLDKPENVIQGIIKGKINKHLLDICLLDQGFVKDEKIKVSQLLDNLSKELEARVTIAAFIYYRVGDET